MTNQLFKKDFPKNIFIEFLEKICIKNDKYLLFNNDAYKRGLFNNLLQEFIIGLKPYYHLSKQKYLERKITYNSFVTILRQICNYCNITYTSLIKYDKSTYNINYYIYY